MQLQQTPIGVSVNVVSKIINQLVDLKVIVPDSTMVKKRDTDIKKYMKYL